jgi:hypothetical protein
MMKECDGNQIAIDELYRSELSEGEQQRLMKHLDECRVCEEYFDLLGRLSAEDLFPEPEPADLLQMRRAVVRRIRNETPTRRPGWLTDLFAARHAFAVGILAVVSAVLLVALGTVIGQPRSERRVDPANGDEERVIGRQIELASMRHRDLSDVENSPWRYSNVQLLDQQGDRVRVSFEVSRHLEMELQKGSPLLADVLVQSVLDPSSIGGQLQAISHAGELPDTKVREALVKAMLEDSNLAVRLEAQSKLVRHGNHPEVRDALLAVLEEEENVQMRLVAIDHLTRHRIDPALLERAVESGDPEGRNALHVRARSYITEF